MHTRSKVVVVVTLCSLVVAAWLLPHAAASEEAREPAKPHAEMALSADHIDWQPIRDYEQVILTIAGPEGLRLQKEFADGQSASLSLFDQEGDRLPDGAYLYELRLVQRKVGPLSERPALQAGSFAVRGGSFATPFEAAKPPKEVKSVQAPAIKNVTAAEEIIPDDLIVQGGACIGLLCETGDAGYPLRLKDTFVSLRFEDVSGGLSYDRDWMLVASPIFGGPDSFFLQDLDAATVPFSVFGDSPDYSLVVGSGGKIGIGTSIPADKLHVLENVNANTLTTVENSNTGTSAAAFLRAKANVGLVQVASHSSGRTIARFGVTLGSRSEILHTGGNGLVMGTLEADDLILGTNNTNRLQINGSTGAVTVSGNLTVNGVFSNPSSLTLKEDFKPLDPKTILDKFVQLPIQEWSYKSDDRKLRHVGPTVEEFQASFGLGTEGQHIFPMDVQGVTMTAVQGLYQLLREKETQIDELRSENSALDARLKALEEALAKSRP